MRRYIEGIEQFAIDVILERRYGKRATLLRVFLRALSVLFRKIVQLRLALFQKRYFREHQLGCMVISIGNLTVGGTGKTPVVEMLGKALNASGRKVAILSRGYKSAKPPLLRRIWGRITGRSAIAPPRIVSDGSKVLLDSRISGDEPYMLAKNLPGVVVLTDKDRVKSGFFAIEKFQSDTLILDDGLQYLHLKHRLDIVLIDRTAPFGNEYLLPRGTLREPPEHLRRAHLIFITKCNDLGNEALIERIRRYNRTADIIECRHAPKYFQDVTTGDQLPLHYLENKYVAAVSGIAVPEGFESILRELGANIEFTKRFTDHHRYDESELRNLLNRCIKRDIDAIVTTEKDAVRLPRLKKLEVPIYFLRIEIEILSGRQHWERCLQLISHPPMHPESQLFMPF